MTKLCANSVSISLGDAQVLAGLDLEITAGEVVGLIGP